MGSFIETLLYLFLFGAIAYLIYRYFAGRKIIINEDMFHQNFVTIDYKTGKITVRGNTFDVTSITGIQMEYYHQNKKFAHRLIVNVDDMIKPIHRVVIVGSEERAATMYQRVCVALRKAGAPDFYVLLKRQ